ncbi:MAG: DUF2281 domain-containing protein [Acaryochloris sp. RU_4_1]|nr:DUF2281 domain-containing protein [Acaryochloris sp. RU_4_1]NJR56505.1 DUF2281 domain-containing protein [Acaryochloris sp. CRU_2_0]
MLETAILENLEKLPESLKETVLHYVESLVAQQENIASDKEKPAKRGALGVLKGKIKIAEDFDEPLKDFENYM